MFQFRYFRFIILTIILFTNNNLVKCLAVDYGVIANVYEIQEQDLLEYIYQKLNTMEQNGEIAKFQEYIQQETFKRLNNPKPVENLTYATEDKQYYFDPSIVLHSDYKDINGNVFAFAGTKINPLDTVSLRNNLIFIDGNSKEQILWAVNQYYKYNTFVKIILVNGAIIDLMQQFNIQLYFDQNATLTKRFNLKHIPVLICQEGNKLLIKEFALHYEKN